MLKRSEWLDSAAMWLRDLFGLELNSCAPGESAALYPALFVSPGQFPAPEAFAEIVGGLRPDEPVLLTDYHAVRWLLLRAEEMTLLLGPFFLQQPGRPVNFDAGVPLLEKQQLDAIVAALAHQLGGRMLLPRREVDLSGHKIAGDISRDEPPSGPFAKYIETAHDTEALYMAEVMTGNAASAKLLMRRIQQYNRRRSGADARDILGARIGCAISRTLARIAARNAGVPSNALDSATQRCLRRTICAASEEECFEIALEMTDEICRLVQDYRTRRYSSSIARAVSCIHERFHDALSVEAVAGIVGLERSYLSAKFHREVGVSVSDYISSVRLEYAARLLSMNSLNIRDVCIASGIPDQSYFSRRFKQIYGVTPTQYRNGERGGDVDALHHRSVAPARLSR